MNTLKNYIQYALAVILILYLVLVWMYFKDNTSQLTASRLLLWFIIIPLFLFGMILLYRWRLRMTSQESENTEQKHDEIPSPTPIKSHQLFVQSSFSVPEGASWQDIIEERTEDLTTLSEHLHDMDELPVLIKPVSNLDIEAAYSSILTYQELSSDDWLDEDANDETSANSEEHDYSSSSDIDREGVTVRLWALIYEQLNANAENIHLLATHLSTADFGEEANVALHAHPDWQSHYIGHTADSVVEKDPTDMALNSAMNALSTLTLTLSISQDADATLLSALIKDYLFNCGIPIAKLSIHMTSMDSDSSLTNNSQLNHLNDANTENHLPISFMSQQLATLASDVSARVCLFIAADTHIHDSWVESQSDSYPPPTEAATLVIFYNAIAQHLLNPDSVVVSLVEISPDIAKQTRLDDEDTLDYSDMQARQYYAKNLLKIKQLLLENNFTPPPYPSKSLDAAKGSRDQSSSAKAITDTEWLSKSLIAISDINPLSQSYDIALFMTFIEEFIEKGALVNDHHLGHYMPSNEWLKTFLSVSMLVDSVFNDAQELNYHFLITQHKRCCYLWFAEPTPMN